MIIEHKAQRYPTTNNTNKTLEIYLVDNSRQFRSQGRQQVAPHYSPKFRNLVNSSSSSCRSASEILFCKLGIRDLASSALSQHKLPVKCQSRPLKKRRKKRLN